MTDALPIRLLGYSVSNYVNVVRAALLEKRLPYSLEPRGGGRDEAFLIISPMGKIPVLEVDGQSLSETVAILEFLDDRFPERPLRPADDWDRARSRQLINIVQLYVEAPARALFPGVFMGDDNPPEVASRSRTTLDVATEALRRIAQPAPFLFGPAVGAADLFAFYNLDIVDRLGTFVWGRSIIDEADLSAWAGSMRELESTRTVLADFEFSFADYLQKKGAAYRARPHQKV